MAKATKYAEILVGRLPDLLAVAEVQQRLALIFPVEFPDRGILVGNMAAKVIFVFLYGGFIEGSGRFLRPSNIYLFTEDQSEKISLEERTAWISTVNKPGNRTAGRRWYADNSRESIRDDLMRNQLLRLGIMHKLPGYATTASTPINYLSAEFAELFLLELTGESLASAIKCWREKNLNAATLQRMALKAQGIQAKAGDLFVEMPDQTRIRISAGPSSDIAKSLIENFAPIHLKQPAVLWISASDKKTYPHFVELAKTVGLEFHPSNELPDLIFADMEEPITFIFCEIVATDGPVTEARKQALLKLVETSSVPASSVKFLTAFEDREAPVFKKNFSQLAVDTLVWFRTEPHLLVILHVSEDVPVMSDAS